MEIFEISSAKLAELYKDLHCDGCGKVLAAEPEEVWAKVGCGYFCAECLTRGVHLTHPACDISRRG